MPDPQPATAADAPSPLELRYAPPPRSAHRPIWVILAGVISTALTLVAVYLLDVRGNMNVMGLYADYVLPAGAIFVGLAASSGYAAMSWWLGVKIRRRLLLTIVALLIGSYFAAEYVTYRSLGPLGAPAGARMITSPTGQITVPVFRRIGFWEYFHRKAVNWRWKKQNSTDPEGQPLGTAGYFFVILGIVGYVGAGLLIPISLGSKAYCDLCERYMRTRRLAVWPIIAAVQRRSRAPNDAAADASSLPQVIEAEAKLIHLRACVAAGDSAGFIAALRQTPGEMKQADKELRRLAIYLISCPSCASGRLSPTVLAGHGKQTRRKKLGETEVPQELVRAALGGTHNPM